jgi:hypothetical protein
MAKKSMIIFVLALGLTACSKSPLDSLKDDAPSLTYTQSFWAQEEKRNSELWQAASKICGQENYQAKPNCIGIRDIEFFAHPLPFPRYGSGHGFGVSNMPVIHHEHPHHREE